MIDDDDDENDDDDDDNEDDNYDYDEEEEDDDDDSRVCATVGCLSHFNYHFYRNLIAFPCFPLPVSWNITPSASQPGHILGTNPHTHISNAIFSRMWTYISKLFLQLFRICSYVFVCAFMYRRS